MYAIALPGFDGRAAAQPPLFDRVTADFWSMLDAQKIVGPVVIGHSLGGTLAIVLGEQHPERLRGIVAVDALPVFPGTERVTTVRSALRRPRSSPRRSTALRTLNSSPTKAGTCAPRAAFSIPRSRDQLANLEANSDPRATAQWLREDVTADLRAGLAQITVPVLEIVPFNPADVANLSFKYTQAQKVAYYRTLLAGAPNVQVASVSPARHFAMLDQPAKVAALLDAFLCTAR